MASLSTHTTLPLPPQLPLHHNSHNSHSTSTPTTPTPPHNFPLSLHHFPPLTTTPMHSTTQLSTLPSPLSTLSTTQTNEV
ncbi:hypothetical protein Pmani_038620 [Petrolisthes manimaculis]|uniref:Uncharacterized protein n=1 Tax=Petrolisthes manimaculis TaxID=1843537 RepID=A0AAE1TK83_9EUCA|nr:hypothetical protein Pmani_038620 [Petrolisthes manimaculis]